jgi:Uma2 family endonuclease
MSTGLAAPPAVRLADADLPDPGPGQELVGGELQKLNVSYLSSFVAGAVYFALRSYVAAHPVGWVAPEGTSFRCFRDDPTRVRRADVAFHRLDRLDRLTADRALSEGHCTVVPDLVVEVVSPNDLADEVNRKCVEWLAAWAALVWVVYPLQQEVHAFPVGGLVRVFGAADTLTAELVLAGFATPAADLFRLPTAG